MFYEKVLHKFDRVWGRMSQSWSGHHCYHTH